MEVKSVGTFSVILVKGHNIARGRGWDWEDDGMSPDPIKKIVIRSRVLCNNYLEGLFHTVPSLLSSIVDVR